MAKAKKKVAPGDVASNRYAAHRFNLLERIECGIVLQGTEVKSLRSGSAQLKDGFASIQGGELWLRNVHIPPYAPASRENHEPERERKLLLHRREIDRLAREGDPDAFEFPVARVPGLDFSFSGLKTALLYATRELDAEELAARRADFAASYQRAIVRALVGRVREAAEQTGASRVAVVGGVAANSELRAALPDAALAPLPLCTDNAAMIASAGRFAAPMAYPGYLGLDAYASR